MANGYLGEIRNLYRLHEVWVNIMLAGSVKYFMMIMTVMMCLWSHYKTVFWPSYLQDGNLIYGKDVLYIETGARWRNRIILVELGEWYGFW